MTASGVRNPGNLSFTAVLSDSIFGGVQRAYN